MSVCCIDGCTKESAYEVSALKREIPLKPNAANRANKGFGLCLDHFIMERDAPSSGQGRVGRRGSNASVEDDASENGMNDDDYNGSQWDDPSGKVCFY